MSVMLKFNLLVITILSLVVVILSIGGGYTFPPAEDFLVATLPIILSGPLALFYTFIRPDKTIATPCWAITIYLLFIPPVLMFGQLMGGLNYPLVDAELAAIDKAMGFDWMEYMIYFASLPDWTSEFSTILYKSTNQLVLLIAVFLIFSGRHRQLVEFVTYFILTGILVNLISGFLPAATAYEYFKPDAALYEKLSPVVGQGYMVDFFALRDGSMRELKLIGATGIVSFPSFHTVLALLLIYVARGCGLFAWVVGIWGIGIVATTPVDGSHYLTDVIGGIVLLAITIAVVRWLEPHLERILSSPFSEPELVPLKQ